MWVIIKEGNKPYPEKLSIKDPIGNYKEIEGF
jgi:hypothetical protein